MNHVIRDNVGAGLGLMAWLVHGLENQDWDRAGAVLLLLLGHKRCPTICRHPRDITSNGHCEKTQNTVQ